MTDDAVPTDQWVRALPKVELHVHVEGAVEPATIAALAAKNGVDLGVADPAELYSYRHLDDFLRVFDLVCGSLCDEADLHRVVYEAQTIAARAGVRYRELFFSPTFLMRHGVAFHTIWHGIQRGLVDAQTDHGIVGRMIMDVHKPAGPGAADELLDLALGCDREVLIGNGGDAGERDIDLASFAPMFERARAAGLRTTMHVGEEGPVADIGIAVDVLHLDRIDHGCSLLDDPTLTARVADQRIAVTACPTSNVAIGIVPTVADHPLMRMRDAGVLVTINSDNAEMFGVDLADEMCRVRDAFHLSAAEIEDFCLAGVEASWLDEGSKRSMRHDFVADMKRATEMERVR
ncbi:MAG: Adenosine deaminase [Ilumatobacteraceae bacterium]|nr:Adenosine deaminase [Ilumatobacteraceae bacterium]